MLKTLFLASVLAITFFRSESETIRKLRLAFGPGCAELKRTIKVNLASKGLVLAADQCDTDLPDGRIKLTPFSAAFVKNAP